MNYKNLIREKQLHADVTGLIYEFGSTVFVEQSQTGDFVDIFTLLAASGALEATITASASGVSLINGISGVITLAPSGDHVQILNDGQFIYIGVTGDFGTIDSAVLTLNGITGDVDILPSGNIQIITDDQNIYIGYTGQNPDYTYTYYPLSGNPSGFLQALDRVLVKHTIPLNQQSFFVPYGQTFASEPFVNGDLVWPSGAQELTTSMVAFNFSGVSTSGVTVCLTNQTNQSGWRFFLRAEKF